MAYQRCQGVSGSGLCMKQTPHDHWAVELAEAHGGYNGNGEVHHRPADFHQVVDDDRAYSCSKGNILEE